MSPSPPWRVSGSGSSHADLGDQLLTSRCLGGQERPAPLRTDPLGAARRRWRRRCPRPGPGCGTRAAGSRSGRGPWAHRRDHGRRRGCAGPGTPDLRGLRRPRRGSGRVAAMTLQRPISGCPRTLEGSRPAHKAACLRNSIRAVATRTCWRFSLQELRALATAEPRQCHLNPRPGGHRRLGVKGAPTPVVSHSCGTWKPRWGPGLRGPVGRP